MERLWSPAGATGGNRWQIARARKPRKQGKTVAVGYDRLPESMVRNAMKEGLPGWQAPACQLGATERRPDFNVARWFGSQPLAPRLPSARRGRGDGRGRCGAARC